ncbi:MAG: molybdopterin molybdenumtransferase MoeA, partial [Rhodobacteraceae bacterium]|nr:molybdopterin molybdenumtransferase MoeA [Paracoccaceae bacterium]
PPPLKNDCFALPPGTVDISEARDLFVAQDVIAPRASPPKANSAVDGYGFAGSLANEEEVIRLALHPERAAAGVPMQSAVAEGQAVRILTGAQLPEGVDTVVLQEDVATDGQEVVFHGPLKLGANTRKAGEDVQPANVMLTTGQRLRATDLSLAASVGISQIECFRRLRIGVLSTGDEVCDVTQSAAPHQIYDANRPMLLSLIAAWGFVAVDLGHVNDDRDQLRERHLSALLSETGSIEFWRIAVKPGRPLAMGMWGAMPIFGLPGNPVAAATCAMIFARPSFNVLAGGHWMMPQSYWVKASFEKRKKPGRREYLRARLIGDQVEVFKSEGSGRISGLSWANGFVELPDHAVTIRHGDLVKFIPFDSFN